jgi:hypothetical protein
MRGLRFLKMRRYIIPRIARPPSVRALLLNDTANQMALSSQFDICKLATDIIS